MRAMSSEPSCDSKWCCWAIGGVSGQNECIGEAGSESLLPGKKVILLAVAVTKVKCIYCCKFFTSWIIIIKVEVILPSEVQSKIQVISARIEPGTSWRLLLYLERSGALYHLTIVTCIYMEISTIYTHFGHALYIIPI
jgi:hypothetical protein